MAKPAEIGLEIGACGWEHAGWIDGFYPDTLPDDWRLTFYSNEYRCVLIPPDYWQRFGPDAAAGWAEDVHAQFRFFPELHLSADGDSPAVSDLRCWCEPLTVCIGGVVVRLDPDAPPAAEALGTVLGQLAALGPLTVDAPGLPAERYRVPIDQVGARRCWRPSTDGSLRGCRIGRLAPAEAAADLRQLRAAVEQFIEQAVPGDDLTLLFEGEPPSVQRMHDVAVILSLLS